jgi:hypothetical protein
LLCQTLDGEFRDRLGLAVVGELEIVDGQVIDGLAFGIADDDGDRNEIDAGAEGDGGFFCGDFRGLGEEGDCGEEERNQREMDADSDGFILSFPGCSVL